MAHGTKEWLQSGYDAITGRVAEGDLGYAQWEDQQFDPNWNVQGQGYDAQGYQGQGYDASQLGPAQGYTAQTGQATQGNYQTGEQFGSVLNQAMDASQQFMDPNSQWARGQRGAAAEQAGQLAGQTVAQQSQQLASMGSLGGGVRSMLGNRAQREAGSQARQANLGIATQGAGLGLQALGQAGQLATAQESNLLQQSLANQAASNQYGLANMQAQNQASQFGAGQQNQFSLANQAAMNQAGQFGAAAQNQANQWSAGQQNQAGQFGAQAANEANQFNASNQMNYQSWNESQAFAANQFNESQNNARVTGNAANVSSTIGGVAKLIFSCIPEGTKIDTPNGSKPIEDLKAGDKIISYNGEPVDLMQKHEYKENPELNRFLKITFDDKSEVDLCDMHRIDGKRSKDYDEGDTIDGKTITSIEWYGGVKISYDLLTNDKGYRISGLPINSMIDEMMYTAYKLKEVA